MSDIPARNTLLSITLLTILLAAGCGKGAEAPSASTTVGTQASSLEPASSLSDAALENLVERSFQYVAMYNVNNKFAIGLSGWNICAADTKLKDHTMRDIARPNNDTLYTACLLDLRHEPIVINIPAFDTKYASLMVTGYDHHVNVPLSTRKGDFQEPRTMLFYTERTEGYDGEPVDGVDIIFEASGDFVSAVFRVMPHANEPERFQRIIQQKQSIQARTLSEYRGNAAATSEPAAFPAVGRTDVDTFANNLLEVMQFVMNHTTFHSDHEDDQRLLSIYAPLGVAPGRDFDPAAVASLDADRLRATAERVRDKWLASMSDPDQQRRMQPLMFQPKGQSDLATILAVSVIGPIGLPREEAMYPAIGTQSGEPMNALHDYVVRMTAEEMPPAKAFWSLTLYDLDNGFFIPNDRKKYSVGENAGMVLDDDGGIEIYIAAEKPEGVPEENWLPIERKDLALSAIMRLYVPDLDKFESWTPPVAEQL